jgi:adenine phosphoribosyltransferase
VSEPLGADGGRHVARVGAQEIDLPLVALGPDLTIALLITVDHGLAFTRAAGEELASRLAPLEIELVATAATMGIPVAMEVTKGLGLDDYLVLHKTPKIHLRDALTEPVRSITTGPVQYLRLDRARLGEVAGKRVAFVDDVISTGSSAAAAVRLLRQAGCEVIAVAALVTETTAWRAELGEDADLVLALGEIPVFRPGADGALAPDWTG